MRKLNLFIWAVFFIFVLSYWIIRKMGYPVDSNTHLMIMVSVLFLLLVIRKILLFRKMQDMNDPYARVYEEEITDGEEASVSTDTLEEKKHLDKKVTLKRGIFIILTFIVLVGFRYGSRMLIKDMMLDGFDSTEELFADIERKQAFRAAWGEYRKEEMRNGGPTYLVEDVFATTLRPDHWRDFFVLTAVPEGFYYKNDHLQSRSPGDFTITEIFYDLETETEFFYFVQSADYDYNKGHVPDGVKKKEGKFYLEEKGTRNQIIWFYDDLTLYLEGNLSLDELEWIAESAVNYDTLSYDYSVLEETMGTYE